MSSLDGRVPAGARSSPRNGGAAPPAPAAEAQLYLLVRGPDGTIRTVASQANVLRIGSDPRCELVLQGPGVCALHARVERADGGIWLTDCSRGGTRVGSALLRGEATPLDPSELIEIAGHHLRLQLAAPIAVPAAEPPRGASPDPAGVDAGPGEPRFSLIHEQIDPGNTRAVSVVVRRRIHRELIDHLDLVRLDRSRMNDHLLRAKVTLALNAIVGRYRWEMPREVNLERLIEELTHEAIGLGPLESLLADPDVTEIMVIDAATIYIERKRRMILTGSRFTDEESLRSILERIVAPLGRRIDESSPLLDARLSDGSRVNAVIRPLALRGTCITIRKFAKKAFVMDDLIRFGTITPRIVRFLERTVAVRKNILISGGTGSGKTTLLNILSGSISPHERVVTIEDAAELRLVQPHVVPLEARPPNMEGKGQITIRDLVRNAMRMRPDRIIVGECRGGEALDMLQAMNTGHSGSMTTTHANSPHEALKRIETLALTAGVDVPARALREQIALALQLVVQQERLSDGSRKITSVAEVVGLDDDGQIMSREIFGYRRTGTGPDGAVQGEFYATGYLPSYVEEFITNGLCQGAEEVL